MSKKDIRSYRVLLSLDKEFDKFANDLANGLLGGAAKGDILGGAMLLMMRARPTVKKRAALEARRLAVPEDVNGTPLTDDDVRRILRQARLGDPPQGGKAPRR
jgi:hypothetical protein